MVRRVSTNGAEHLTHYKMLSNGEKLAIKIRNMGLRLGRKHKHLVNGFFSLSLHYKL